MGYPPQAGTALPPSGQPMPYKDGEVTIAKKYPRMFGMGFRELYGVPKALVIPNPAAGVDWVYNFIGPSWYIFHFGTAQLVASAQVATREIVLNIKYNSVLVGQFSATFTQTAGQNVVYSIAPTPVSIGTVSGTSQLPVVDNIILKDGMSMGTVTQSIQTGDQWENIGLMLEEFTDRCLDL